MAHGRECDCVRQEHVAGVVTNGNGRADGLGGDVCQRHGSGGTVGIVERHDVIAGIPGIQGNLRRLAGIADRLTENGEAAEGPIG